MKHHCFPCPICGACYLCMAEIGAYCFCEELTPPERYAIDVQNELKAECRSKP